jgi:signal peptidase I
MNTNNNSILNDSEQIKQIKIRRYQKIGFGLVGAFALIAGLVYLVGSHNITMYGNALPVGQITGHSMEPTYQAGQWVIYYTPDKKTIQEGDVIVYSKAITKALVVHRVQEILPDGSMITRGDNNQASDQELLINSRPVHPDEVLGVVAGPLQLEALI